MRPGQAQQKDYPGLVKELFSAFPSDGLLSSGRQHFRVVSSTFNTFGDVMPVVAICIQSPAEGFTKL